MEQLASHRTDFHEIWYLISFRKLQFHSNLTTAVRTLHEAQYAFLIIALSFLLTVRYVSYKSGRKNQNTLFIRNNFIFPKSLRL